MSKCPKRQVLPQMTQNLTKSDIEVGFVNDFWSYQTRLIFDFLLIKSGRAGQTLRSVGQLNFSRVVATSGCDIPPIGRRAFAPTAQISGVFEQCRWV